MTAISFDEIKGAAHKNFRGIVVEIPYKEGVAEVELLNFLLLPSSERRKAATEAWARAEKVLNGIADLGDETSESEASQAVDDVAEVFGECIRKLARDEELGSALVDLCAGDVSILTELIVRYAGVTQPGEASAS